MKKIVFNFLLTCLVITSSGQTSFLSFPMENGKVTYKEVVEAKDPSSVLFNRAHQFLLSQDFYGPGKVVCKNGKTLNQPIVTRKTDILDSATGKVGGKAFYIVNYGSDTFFTLNFDYEVKVKDNLYRYELKNFFIYEYRSIPSYATKTENLNIPLEKIVADCNIDVYTLEDFRMKLQFPATTQQTVMSCLDKFINSLKQTMSGTKPVEWE